MKKVKGYFKNVKIFQKKFFEQEYIQVTMARI